MDTPPPRRGPSGCGIAIMVVVGIFGLGSVLVCGGLFWLRKAHTERLAYEAAQATVAISPAELVAAYHANEVAANRVYQNQRLELRGAVFKIAEGPAGVPVVLIEADHLMRRVQCTFSGPAGDRFAQLAKGDEIVVRGTCRGLLVHVRLTECELLESLAATERPL